MRPARSPRAMPSRCWSGSRMRRRPQREGPAPARCKTTAASRKREIEFAPRGVTIVTGPNEVGKSSLSEAIDLLFDERDDTAKQRVREIQPVDRDEGSEVEVDAVGRPVPLQATPSATTARARRGSWFARRASSRRPAARRTSACGRCSTRTDTALWRALRIVQGAPLDAPALAGATSLVAALDRAAGVGAGGEREESLFERARAAYDRHFTPTGRARRGYASGAAGGRRGLGRGVATASAARRARARCRCGSGAARAGRGARAADRGGPQCAPRARRRTRGARGAARRGRAGRCAARGRARAGVGRRGRSRASADSSSPRTPARRPRWRASRRRSRARRPRTSRPRRSCATWRSGCSRRAARARALRRW